jgi:hypothetical protein
MQCSHTSQGIHVSKTSISSDTFPPTYPATNLHHHYIWTSLIPAMSPKAHTNSAFHTYLLDTPILMKPKDSILS